MLRRCIPILTVLLLTPAIMLAQLQDEHASEWQYSQHAPSDTSVASTHGLAFDGEGKVWGAGFYAATDSDGNNARLLYCVDLNTDEACEFGPVYEIEHEDTTFRFGQMTGIAADHNGDILVAMHGHIYNSGDEEEPNYIADVSRTFFARIDHQTGEGLDVAEVTVMRDDDNSHAYHLATDDFGNVFYSAVFPGQPIYILDESLNELGQVTDNRSGFARGIAVNGDGTKVYQPTDNMRIEVYESELGAFGSYELVDTTLGAGMDPGTVTVCPQTGVVYAWASGSGWDPLADDELWDINTLYGFNPNAGYEVVDSLTWDFGDGEPAFHPYRGADISADGLSFIGGSFGGQGIQLFTREELLTVTSGEEFVTETPEGYTLDQNYPNPFNPVTQINFTMADPGHATLTVYDMLGREVATLVNESLQAGSHSVQVDATSWASGSYIYRLDVGEQQLTRTMMLIK